MSRVKNIKKYVQFHKADVFGIDVVFQIKNHLDKIKKSLKLIQSKDEALFKKVLQIKTILVFPGDDEHGEVFPRQRIWVIHFKTVREITIVYLASLAVHEAWHILQYKRGVRNIDSRGERGAYLVQKRFLILVGNHYSAKWLDKAYEEKWWEDKDSEHKTRPTRDNKQTRKQILGFLKKYKQGKLPIKEIRI